MKLSTSIFLCSFMALTALDGFAQGDLSVDVNSRIDYREMEYEGPRSSWCVFTEYSSHVNMNHRSAESKETSGKMKQILNYQSKSYQLRTVNWNGSLEGNRLKLNFTASRPVLNAYNKYDNNGCKYRAWKAELSHAKVEYKGQAQIIIPDQVWVLKVKVRNFDATAPTDIKLTNFQYKDAQMKDEDVTEVLLPKFSLKSGEFIFLVNPSTVNQENLIKIYVHHLNQQNHASKFELDLEVEFLGQKSCMESMAGKTVDQLMAIDEMSLGKKVEAQACLLNHHYVKYVLDLTPITKFNDLFDTFQRSESKLLSLEPKSSYEQHLINIHKELIDRARFYYAFEIVKDFMRVMAPVDTGIVDQQGNAVYVSGLLYLEGLRLRQRFYILNAIDKVEEILRKSQQNPGLYKNLTREQQTYLSILVDNIVPEGLHSLDEAFGRFVPPSLMGNSDFALVSKNVKRIVQTSGDLKGSLELWNFDRVSPSQMESFLNHLAVFRGQMQDYFSSWTHLQAKLNVGGGEAEEIISNHRILNAQMRAFASMYLDMLKDSIDRAFYDNFEDQSLLELPVNGVTYKDPAELMEAFKRMMNEL